MTFCIHFNVHKTSKFNGSPFLGKLIKLCSNCTLKILQNVFIIQLRWLRIHKNYEIISNKNYTKEMQQSVKDSWKYSCTARLTAKVNRTLTVVQNWLLHANQALNLRVLWSHHDVVVVFSSIGNLTKAFVIMNCCVSNYFRLLLSQVQKINTYRNSNGIFGS